MNILMMAVNDPAGTAINFCKFLNRHTGHTARLVTLEIRYNFMFDKDLHLPWFTEREWAELEYLLGASDVFHFHMTADEDLDLGRFRPRDFMRGKMLVHHHHGHPDFRGNPQKYRDKYKARGRDRLLVSTPDLLKLLPGATWQPNPVPCYDARYMPMGGKPHAPLRIAHSPTRKDLKNTDDLVRVVSELTAEGLCLEMDLIENTEHGACLRRKRRCNVLFDHLQGYFGVSSLEGLSQGLCVMAGIDDWNREHVCEFTGRETLPWYVSGPASLKKDLTRLAKEPEIAVEYGAYARRFIEDHWTPRIIAEKLAGFYES